MGDNFFVAALLVGIFLVGVASFIWPDFMSALMGGFWLRVLPRSIRRPLTRILGAVTILFALFLSYAALKDVFR